MATAIRVELQLANGDFTSGMLRAGQSIAQFQQQLIRANPSLRGLGNNISSYIRTIDHANGSTKGFLATIRDLSIITGVVSLGIGVAARATNGWAGDIVRVNAEMQRLMVQMRSMAKSADPIKEAAENVSYLRQMAMQSPFAINNLAQAFVKLQSTGIDPMSGSLQSLVDGVAAFGGTSESLSRVVLAVSQISGKGVLQMEELRQQLGESMPRAVELMARSMGVGMAELIQTIQTGRVAAGPALQALYDELERTYGGRAKQMMQTFDGQLKQTATLWQTLMTTIGGLNNETGIWSEDGFFSAVTNQLGDLNELLARPATIGFARDLGAGLANIVHLIRDTINTLIAFRREIQTVAVVAGSAFAFTAATRGIAQLGVSFATMTLELQRARMVWAGAGTWFAAAQGGFTSLNTVMTASHMTALGLGTALKGVAIGFMAALPWIAAVGLAVYTAAEYFDWFGNKARNAYEDLQKFGAESRDQAKQTIADRQAQLDKDIAVAEKQAELQKHFYGINPEGNAYLQGLYAQRAELVAEGERLIAEAGEREDERGFTAFQKALQKRLDASQVAYNDEAVLAQDHAEAELLRREETGRSAAEIEEERQKQLIDARRNYARADLAIIEELLAANKEAQARGIAEERERLKKEYALLIGKSLELKQQLSQIGLSGGGISLVTPVEDQEKLMASGQTRLDNLRDSVAQLRAEFFGASGEYAKLQAAIARGDYGSIAEGGEEVAELHEQLRAATRQKEILDELMTGRTKAEAEVERLRKRALEDQLTAQMKLIELKTGKKFTDAEALAWKIDNGWFDGVGDESQIRTFLDTIIAKFGEVGVEGVRAGDTLENEAFGASQVEAINTVISAVNRLKGAVMGVNGMGQNFDLGFSAAGGDILSRAIPADLPKEATDRMALAMQRLMSKGWSQAAAAGWVGNMMGESSLNPNARNPGDGRDGSDSIGIAQWNAERARNLKAFAAERNQAWNDFNTQLDFADWEMKNKFSAVAGRLALAATPEVATDLVLRKWEIPKDPDGVYSKRASYAQAAYNSVGAGSMPAGAYGAGLQGPSLVRDNQLLAEREGLIRQQVAATHTLKTTLEGTAAVEADTEGLVRQAAKLELLKDLQNDTEAAGLSTEKLGSAYKRVVDAIKAGELGASTDVAAEEYKDVVAAAKELDAVNEKIKAADEARTAIATDQVRLKEQQAKLEQQIADANARIKDPNFKGISGELQTLSADLDAYVEHFRVAYGEQSNEYQSALNQRTQMLQQQRLLEATQDREAMAQERTAIETSLMSKSQQRQVAMQREMAAVDAWIERARAAGMAEVEIVREAEAQKAAIRAQYANAMNPMAAQMQEWGDLQANLTQQSTQWMDSLAGGITDLIMGTGDLRSMINGILKDMINMLVKYSISSMMGGKGGGTMKAGGGTAKAVGGGMGKLFGIAHTGGVIGKSTLKTRRASAAAFAGAPRYHTGGIIGGLGPDEVPIIAQRGEGVFTPEQMKALGGSSNSSSFHVENNIKIEGSAGSPEQNQDLADRLGKQLEVRMRSIAASEITRQTRPGNTLNTRSR